MNEVKNNEKGQGKNVLIVDDDEYLCNELVDVLTDDGHRVTYALSGDQAAPMIRSNSYDVIILDLKLPDINGQDLLQVAKKKSPKSRVIILTGAPFVEASEYNKVANEGAHPMEARFNMLSKADLIINKPCDVEALKNGVRYENN